MSLWVDKHRPRSLDKLKVHEKQAKQLKKLVSAGDCPHLLFYGPSGSGKKTLCLGTLKELFGPGVEKLRTEQKTWQIQLPTRKIEVELATVKSNYHLELSPAVRVELGSPQPPWYDLHTGVRLLSSPGFPSVLSSLFLPSSRFPSSPPHA